MSIEKEIYHLQNHVVILGYNDRVERIVEELNGEGVEDEEMAVLIAADIESCPAERFQNVHLYRGNPTKESTLKELKLDQAKVVLVVADHKGGKEEGGGSLDAQTVLTVITLHRFLTLTLDNGQTPPRIIAECMEENTLEHLKNAGCDEIILIGSTSAALLAASVINPGITQFFSEVFSTLFGHEFYIVPPPRELHGMTFLQALKWLKVNYGDIIVAVKRGKQIFVNPRRFVILKDDEIVVLSRHKPYYHLHKQHTLDYQFFLGGKGE
ncbi:MAG: hypothetical protein D6785_04540 [Planctomycetota bacterium]|nr:MAG: hypothetical protein D6785_04540 [Planctomycetota bacterium]